MKIIFFLSFILIILTLGNGAAVEEVDLGKETQEKLNVFLTSLRGASSFLPQNKLTCKTDPTLCFVGGSPGPYCCKKVCVDIYSDRNNCGTCKNKCKNNQMCCHGNCVPANKGCGSSAV